eukprot:208602_1
MSSVAEREHENTRNVLVILLGWNGANPRNLSKYNAVYDTYEDHIENLNNIHNNRDRVHTIIKQYIAPIHMTMFNMCMLRKWVLPILNAIRNHRETFGSSSHVIIHSFSSAGTLILGAMNDHIIKDKLYHMLYYDGIVYDSPHLGSLSVYSGALVMWELLSIHVLSRCVCYNDADRCGCLFIWCKILYSLVWLITFIVFVVMFPIMVILAVLYLLITCSADFIFCHHQKLLCVDDIRIVSVPMLLLGSNKDHINPVNKSLQFVNDKMDIIARYKAMSSHTLVIDGRDETEDTALLRAEDQTPFHSYRTEFIEDANRYFIFENSAHVKHYRRYPKTYQREVNHFLDLCLKIDNTKG